MKLKHLFTVFFIIAIVFNVFAKGFSKGNPVVTIHFSFINIVDSCNYINRINVYIDGFKIITSTEKKQSEANSVTFYVKKGKHNIKVIDEVLFMDNWEEQTITNNYNIDAIYESNMFIKGNININILFDIDKGVSIIP